MGVFSDGGGLAVFRSLCSGFLGFIFATSIFFFVASCAGGGSTGTGGRIFTGRLVTTDGAPLSGVSVSYGKDGLAVESDVEGYFEMLELSTYEDYLYLSGGQADCGFLPDPDFMEFIDELVYSFESNEDGSLKRDDFGNCVYEEFYKGTLSVESGCDVDGCCCSSEDYLYDADGNTVHVEAKYWRAEDPAGNYVYDELGSYAQRSRIAVLQLNSQDRPVVDRNGLRHYIVYETDLSYDSEGRPLRVDIGDGFIGITSKTWAALDKSDEILYGLNGEVLMNRSVDFVPRAPSGNYYVDSHRNLCRLVELTVHAAGDAVARTYVTAHASPPFDDYLRPKFLGPRCAVGDSGCALRLLAEAGCAEYHGAEAWAETFAENVDETWEEMD